MNSNLSSPPAHIWNTYIWHRCNTVACVIPSDKVVIAALSLCNHNHRNIYGYYRSTRRCVYPVNHNCVIPSLCNTCIHKWIGITCRSTHRCMPTIICNSVLRFYTQRQYNTLLVYTVISLQSISNHTPNGQTEKYTDKQKPISRRPPVNQKLVTAKCCIQTYYRKVTPLHTKAKYRYLTGKWHFVLMFASQ